MALKRLRPLDDLPPESRASEVIAAVAARAWEVSDVAGAEAILPGPPRASFWNILEVQRRLADACWAGGEFWPPHVFSLMHWRLTPQAGESS